ncbi:hypothetical protein SAMN05660493_00806 [Epilithonimonas bovis DSM 19482]|uniref:DoxX protein n=1 Tax=Epilithonimonas bovis DSM 19482 TaxID=1121284 RepID=A0A1U7PUF1_9FLAO|nr:hypothetical protein [Epilithonimonas bovis]SIT96134.1 hypothetical protein SAMN05660493_00806 [Epilithonimonas bovis DSM 19482]
MFKKKYLKEVIYWVSIFIISSSMFIYGLSKPTQFENTGNFANISTLSGQQLMWIFYGYSKTYPIIIGLFEILGALTILFRKTRIFGCLILTTILINIIIQDYIFNIVALSSAIYYQILIIIILIFDYSEVKKIMKSLFSSAGKSKINIFVIVIALIIALILKFYETKII